MAVSGKGEGAVAAALSELVRRDVLHILADPLSPERGSYGFSQEMLRQVAYETLSKNDRKSRHLAVAAHLRATFANDGEEIADAIARHYLDALAAGTQDSDAEEITAGALHFLIRAAERAERSGALARATESYAEAAAIAPSDQAPTLFEMAARASLDSGDLGAAIAHADAARDCHISTGDERGAARAQGMKGWALQRQGRLDAARVELAESLEVLRPDPDTDTVMALDNLATVEVFSGNTERGESLATEALALAQGLDVGASQLAYIFISPALPGFEWVDR